MPPQFITETIHPGVMGIDIKHPVDVVESIRLVRMTNVVRTAEGKLTGRPGLEPLFDLGFTPAKVWFVLKFKIPEALGLGTFDYLMGLDNGIYGSIDGATPTLLSGAQVFTGPYSLSVAQAPKNGLPWLYVWSTDGSGRAKFQIGTHRFESIGLPVPVNAQNKFRIDEFSPTGPDGVFSSVDRAAFCFFGFTITSSVGGGEESDFTQYGPLLTKEIESGESTSGWTANAGTGGSSAAVVVDTTDFKTGTGSLKFTTDKGAATTRYYNFFIKQFPATINLNSLGGAGASDEDIIHLWLKTDRPDKVEEIRFYFILNSGTFSSTTLPGTGTENNEFYLKTVRPSDFSNVLMGVEGTTVAAGSAAGVFSVNDQLAGGVDDRSSTALIQSQFEQPRWSTLQMFLGSSWQEVGVIGYPLHRGEFRRGGGDADVNWSDIVGMAVAIQVADNTTGINFWLDDLYLTGGAGLDSSILGMQPYDYRYTNYDTDTGVEGNPSSIQAPGFRLDSLRRAIIVTPGAFPGHPTWRQRFYRRGGSLNNNWFLIGQNTSNGAPFTDTATDASLVNTPFTLSIDNDLPVTTENADGEIITANLKSVWGPVNEIMFGCGDPNRPGHLYWSRPGSGDQWPSSFRTQVTAPTDELMAGCTLFSNSYVFSREGMYSILPNLQDVSRMAVLPTACTHGLIGRRAYCIAYGTIFFGAEDGVYRTQGGGEQTVTDEYLRPLFAPDSPGAPTNGYFPVDFNFPDDIVMEAHDNEVWLIFRDTAGNLQTWIFSVLYNYWRHSSFTPRASVFHSDVVSGRNLLLVGAHGASKIYTNEGTDDDSVAIAARITTPSSGQGEDRQDKLYGDIVVDIDRQGNPVTITPLYDEEAVVGASTVLSTLTGRNVYYPDTQATQGRTAAIDVTWSTTTAPPIIYTVGISVSPQTDTTAFRVTDWESGGRLSDKYVKGMVFECDTLGVAKPLDILADGVVQTSISVTAAGRQVVEVSFPQFRGRLLRIKPTTGTEWKLYSYFWIFDQEPLSLTRWETQEVTHGAPGWHSILYGNITIKSSATVDLTIIAYRQDSTSTTKVYHILTTGGVKIKRFVPFEAQKGIMFKYVFSSTAPFWLYRGESEVRVQLWGGGAIDAKPFGDDDLDLTRSLNDAGFIADRSGWNLENTTSKVPGGEQPEELTGG